MIELSCIIPTHNRGTLILKTLAALSKQSYSGQYEVILVDDGSIDNTHDIISDFIRSHQDNKIIWRYIRQENKGPAAARNNGIRNSDGKYVAFLGDDTIPDKEFIKAHVDLLNSGNNICSLGMVDWHPEAQNKLAFAFKVVGIEIDYDKITNPDNCDFTYFCTANVALQKRFLEDSLFDEKFIYPAMEDTELGYRLSQKGLRIVLNRKALVFHLHNYTETDIIKRQQKIGKSVSLLIRKHPELKRRFVILDGKLTFLLCAFLVRLKCIKFINRELYWIIISTNNKYKFWSK